MSTPSGAVKAADEASDERSARYVYGIVRSDTELGPLEGIDGGQVSVQRCGPVAALTSAVPPDRRFGRRDDLLGHDRVLRSVSTEADVVPLRFGAVMIDADAVVDDFVAPNEQWFLEALDALRGTVQFTLRGRYEQEVVLREILAEDPEILQLRQALADQPPEAGYASRIHLGEQVVAALAAKREVDSSWIAEMLEPHAVACSLTEPSSPDDVIDAAFLVRRGQHRPLEEAAETAGRYGGDRIRLRLLGPLAPYDFVPTVTPWDS